MRIAIPVAGGRLSGHFGHCEQFTFFDTQDNQIKNIQHLSAPPHEPGAFPKWLKAQGVNTIITGGMGQRAQSLFAEKNIQVVCGASSSDPKEIVRDFLQGRLETGDNVCDH